MQLSCQIYVKQRYFDAQLSGRNRLIVHISEDSEAFRDIMLPETDRTCRFFPVPSDGGVINCAYVSLMQHQAGRRCLRIQGSGGQIIRLYRMFKREMADFEVKNVRIF